MNCGVWGMTPDPDFHLFLAEHDFSLEYTCAVSFVMGVVIPDEEEISIQISDNGKVTQVSIHWSGWCQQFTRDEVIHSDSELGLEW